MADLLAIKVAARFQAGGPPGKSPRAPTKFTPRVKLDEDEPVDITEVTKEAAGSVYQKLIQESVHGFDPGEVEAMMRVYESTLDGLSRSEFIALAKEAVKELKTMTPSDRQELARSYGLHRR